MGSYGRRPTYVQASFFNNRLFPHQDPSLPTSTPDPASPASLAVAPMQQEGEETDAGVQVPPPQYFRSTRRPTTNSALSINAKLGWTKHPVVGFEWNRPLIWWNVLIKGEREEVSSQWPAEWLDSKERISTSFDGSRRSATGHSQHSSVDSAIELSSLRPSKSHSLQPIFAARISSLNTDVIPKFLHFTRVVMAILEICNFSFIILLVTALAVTRGKQVPFLQGVEVLLVMLILINAGGYNTVRVSLPSFSLRTESRLTDLSRS